MGPRKARVIPEYTTSDMGTAAYLLARGHPVLGVVYETRTFGFRVVPARGRDRTPRCDSLVGG
jgi:hypothetical protein